MDPVSHAVTGASLAGVAAPAGERRRAAFIGALAGMAPDLDVLITSATDPLLQIEHHRGFTHAIGFVPVGALLVALPLFLLLKKRIPFGRVYLYALIGWLHHGFLDAATSYGTQLWWPFSGARVAWSLVSVVDPLYTIPILIAVVLFLFRPRRGFALFAVAWAVAYLALGGLQQHRALAAAQTLADARGHSPQVVEAKPSIFNNILFRTLYEYEGVYYVDAVRVGYFSRPRVFQGHAVPVLVTREVFPELPPDSVLAEDIERFRVFSMGYLYRAPSDPELVADLRYSLLPNSIRPLWGIRADPARPDEHAPFETFREVDPEIRNDFFSMLFSVASETEDAAPQTTAPEGHKR